MQKPLVFTFINNDDFVSVYAGKLYTNIPTIQSVQDEWLFKHEPCN